MREICIVPTFQRSDMLAVCLEAIHAADPGMDVHCFPDRGSDERLVCERFGATHHLTISHNYHGNSYNMLEALKWAYSRPTSASVVYVVEDDCIIDPTFFDWARAALALRPTLFAACGWRYSPDALPPADGPDILIPWYLSVCAALPRRSLAHILQHARPEYYSDMQRYLDAAYPASHRRGSMHYEQDGLVLRVCESVSGSCAWPRRPRGTHIGFRGYHMPQGHDLSGTLDDRIAVIRLLLKNPDLLSALMAGSAPPEIAHCITCDKPVLTSDQTAFVRCADCFHTEFPGLPRTTPSHYYFPNIHLPSPPTGVSSETGV
jgi:hypothetical protein